MKLTNVIIESQWMFDDNSYVQSLELECLKDISYEELAANGLTQSNLIF